MNCRLHAVWPAAYAMVMATATLLLSAAPLAADTLDVTLTTTPGNVLHAELYLFDEPTGATLELPMSGTVEARLTGNLVAGQVTGLDVLGADVAIADAMTHFDLGLFGSANFHLHGARATMYSASPLPGPPPVESDGTFPISNYFFKFTAGQGDALLDGPIVDLIGVAEITGYLTDDPGNYGWPGFFGTISVTPTDDPALRDVTMYFPFEFFVPVYSEHGIGFSLTGTFTSSMTAVGTMDVSSLIVVPEPTTNALLIWGSVLLGIGVASRRLKSR